MTSPPTRVETVPVRRMGPGPIVVAVVALTLVAVSIAKPWSGGDPGTADRSRDFASSAAVAVGPAIDMPEVAAGPTLDVPTVTAGPADHAPAASAPGGTSPVVASPGPSRPGGAPRIAAVEPQPLPPGQVTCGWSGWELVTLGSFLRWTVRTLTAITPVEAAGPGDPGIPVLSLGESDVAGMSACAPSISPTAPARASRIVEAWRRGSAGATNAGATSRGPTVPLDATLLPAAAASGVASPATDGGAGTAGSWERITLAQLDPLPSGGYRAALPISTSATELVRPVPASLHGRWPAGRYLLRLASPDTGGDRWIAVDIGTGR